MSDHRHFSRRGFLRGVGIAAGAAVGTRIAGKEWEREARAATGERSVVISVFLNGGYNALFSSADSFQGASFGVTNNNVTQLQNGLVVDRSFADVGFNAAWMGRMVSIGNRHGSTDHGTAQRNNFSDGARSFPLRLAAAIGGDAPFKAVALGNMPAGPNGAEDGVSMQRIETVNDAVNILTGGTPNTRIPARNIAAEGLTRANAMSGGAIGRNKESLVSYKDGYATQIDALRKPVKEVNVEEIATAYNRGLNTNFGGGPDGMRSKALAAELMIRAGANFIYMQDGGWDTHGDRDGSNVRGMMRGRILPALKILTDRIAADPELDAMNITLMIHGDFARSLPGSDHAAGTMATILSKNTVQGTTGRLTGQVGFPPANGRQEQLWSYLAALSKVDSNPFGANPYTRLVK